MTETPWGYYDVLYNSPHCKVKKLVIKPGKRTSLQYHVYRYEIWSVISGKCQAICDNQVFNIAVGYQFDIPKLCKHRIINKGRNDLVIIEMQIGMRVEEEDITRIEDDYGRIENDRQKYAHLGCRQSVGKAI